MKNKLIINTLTILISSLYSNIVFAQIFDSAQNPLSVKWSVIEVNGFKIIYPKELEKEAQRTANNIVAIYPKIGTDLKQQKTSIPIVLQNRGTQANGFVQLAPKKSQFYTTPPQQFDSQDWLNNLAVHELRHVAQFDRITGGKTRPFDEVYFAYLGAALPLWFLEGDAVSTETSLTNAGRGRQPNWIMPLRAQILGDEKPSYSRAYFGSQTQVNTGYYQLGYTLVSQLRKEYGKSAIDSLLYDINQRPLRPYPFARSLKKLTGMNTRRFYLHTLDTLSKLWTDQAEGIASKNYPLQNKPAKVNTDYLFPSLLANGDIVALKRSYQDAPHFVLIKPDQTEQQLFRIGYQETAFFSHANNLLVWDEIREDPRFKQRSYSVICTYNLATKKTKRLTFGTRLFSPNISADGKTIVAVQIGLDNASNLVLIDSQTGKVTTTLPNPENDILQTPAVNSDATAITWVAVNESGKSLWLKNASGNQQLLSPQNQQLGRPTFIGDKIVFNAHFSGLDNVYEIDVASKKISSLTASKYGAFNASAFSHGDSILFNSFEPNGYQVAKAKIERQPITKNSFVFLGQPAVTQENTGNVFDNVEQKQLASKPYKPLAHLLNLHSLSPDIDANDYPGLQLKSNDLLNYLSLNVGAAYNTDMRKLEYSAGASFKALYPVFSTNYKYRPRVANYRYRGNMYRAEWYENYLNLNVSAPINFSAYNHNYSIVAALGTSYTQRNLSDRDAALLKDKVILPLEYRIGFTHQVRTAERDITPRWAQVFNVKYFSQPFDKDLRGDLIAFESFFYFPGLAKNHSFLASFNYQTQSGNTAYGNQINTGFGYAQIKAKSQLQNTMFFMYRAPLLFPDWEIGPLAYVKNLRGGIFAGYENIGTETNLSQPKSFGFELRSTMHLLRYQPLIDVGGRMIFVNKTYNQNPIFELLFNYNF